MIVNPTEIKDIHSGWRGTCCKILLSNDNFKKYLEFISCNNANDEKNRFHYYIKSFILPQIVQIAGFKNVFHVGFGANERYPLSYEYFGINFFGCELPENENQSWFKSRYIKNKRNLILKNFLEWNIEDFSAFSPTAQNDLIVVSEATFYYFLLENDDYKKRHVAANFSTNDLILQFKNAISSFIKFGITSFMFIEPDNLVFEEIAKENNMIYSKFEFNENFKYDFLLDYEFFRNNSKYFPNIHIISKKDLSFSIKEIVS